MPQYKVVVHMTSIKEILKLMSYIVEINTSRINHNTFLQIAFRTSVGASRHGWLFYSVKLDPTDRLNRKSRRKRESCNAPPRLHRDMKRKRGLH